MNDEIKEILEIFKQVDLEPEAGGCYNCPKKDKDKTCIGCLNDAKDKLLDYITNLQKENERLKTKTKEQSLLLIDYQDMEQKLEDYKSRIEKAVEYINKKWEEHTYYERNENHLGFCEFSEFEKTDLLDILNGRSVE